MAFGWLKKGQDLWYTIAATCWIRLFKVNYNVWCSPFIGDAHPELEPWQPEAPMGPIKL
jgi:hypothetical protein